MGSTYPSFGGAAARQCMRCGAPLAPNQSQCARCGAYSSVPQSQQPGMFQQGPGFGASGSSWNSQSPQTPQQFPPTNGGSAIGWGPVGQGSEQNNLFAQSGQLSSPSQPLQPGLFPPSPGYGQPGQSAFNNPNQSALNNSFGSFRQVPNTSLPNQSAVNNSFGSFQQIPNTSLPNSSLGLFPPNSNPPSLNTFFTPTQQNNYSASPVGMQNGLVQRNWQGFQASQQRNNRGGEDDEDNDDKRTHPLVIVLIAVLSLALIGGGLGAWHVLQSNNGLANASGTPVPVVTPSVTPLFSDSFQNNNNGWDTTQPAGASISISGGKMVLESDNNELFEELLPNGKAYSDLRIDVNADLTKGAQGNGYGIYIRGALGTDGALDTYYRFEVYGDGTFAVYKGVVNDSGSEANDTIKKDTVNPAISIASYINHLTVIAKGSQMTFEVNGTTVTTFSDNTYKGGSIALFVSNVPGVAKGAQTTFTNLAVFPVS